MRLNGFFLFLSENFSFRRSQAAASVIIFIGHTQEQKKRPPMMPYIKRTTATPTKTSIDITAPAKNICSVAKGSDRGIKSKKSAELKLPLMIVQP